MTQSKTASLIRLSMCSRNLCAHLNRDESSGLFLCCIHEPCVLILSGSAVSSQQFDEVNVEDVQ